MGEYIIEAKGREYYATGAYVGEIVRCRDCKWYEPQGGYCHAAKHGHWSKHWEISIRRTYEPNFYCADGERRGAE